MSFPNADQAAGCATSDGDEDIKLEFVPCNTQLFHNGFDDGPGFDDLF